MYYNRNPSLRFLFKNCTIVFNVFGRVAPIYVRVGYISRPFSGSFFWHNTIRNYVHCTTCRRITVKIWKLFYNKKKLDTIIRTIFKTFLYGERVKTCRCAQMWTSHETGPYGWFGIPSFKMRQIWIWICYKFEPCTNSDQYTHLEFTF